MKFGKAVSMLGLFTMTTELMYDFTYGDFMEDGKELLSTPRGIVSLVNFNVGFTLFLAGSFIVETRYRVR